MPVSCFRFLIGFAVFLIFPDIKRRFLDRNQLVKEPFQIPDKRRNRLRNSDKITDQKHMSGQNPHDNISDRQHNYQSIADQQFDKVQKSDLFSKLSADRYRL